MLYPGLLHPKPLPLQQSTADPYLCRRTKPLFTSKNQCLKWTKCTCILAREMDVKSRHQYQNQFRTDSIREQVWGRRWSSFFSLIKTSVLTDFFFFFATMCNYFHLKFKGFSSRDV